MAKKPKKKAEIKRLQRERRIKKATFRRSIIFRSFDDMRDDSLFEVWPFTYSPMPDVEQCIAMEQAERAFKRSVLHRKF